MQVEYKLLTNIWKIELNWAEEQNKSCHGSKWFDEQEKKDGILILWHMQ